MRWRCGGGAVEVRWRCGGGAVEVRWRCGGGAVEVRCGCIAKSLYSRPLVSDHLCRSLMRVSTAFLMLAEGNWFLKLYNLVLLPHS